MRSRRARIALVCGLLCTGWLAFNWLQPASADAELWLHPYLQQVRQDSAVVAWVTLQSPGTGQVEVSRDGIIWERSPSVVKRLAPEVTALSFELFQHRAELRGLAADTLYYYRVLVNGEPVMRGEPAGQFSFRTPGGDPIRFLVFGDSGDGGPVQAEIARRMSEEAADFVLHTGDLAYPDGTFQEFQSNHFNVYWRMMSRMPMFTAPGNHEFHFRDGAGYRALVAPGPMAGESIGAGLHYSFNWGPVHLTVLDSNAPLTLAAAGEGDMLSWLEQDLQKAQGRWLIVMFHHTPFPVKHHKGNDPCLWAQQFIAPILEKRGVHLVLNGHEHLYMRSKPWSGGKEVPPGWGPVYLTTGGGGAELHPVPDEKDPFTEVQASTAHYLRARISGLELKVQAVDVNGAVIDEFHAGAETLVRPGGVRDPSRF